MTNLFNAREIDNQKAMGNYRLAGQMARILGLDDFYGCHFGMKSELPYARDQFHTGWQEIDAALEVRS